MSRPLPTDEAALARLITARWTEVKAAVKGGSPLTLARTLLAEDEDDPS